MTEKLILNEEIDLNMDLRGEILGYSLVVEDLINELLLKNLGIVDDKNTTKLFGQKVGITFKNKIDLLYDIGVLSKGENVELELFMNFRNKFLHVLDCNSFQMVLSQFDNSIKNKFKSYFNENKCMEDEMSCRFAYRNLYRKNVQTIQLKIEELIQRINDKNNIIQNLNQNFTNVSSLFFYLLNDLYFVLENAELENLKVRKLSEDISSKCQQYLDKYIEDVENSTQSSFLEKFFRDNNRIKNYFGITKSGDKI